MAYLFAPFQMTFTERQGHDVLQPF